MAFDLRLPLLAPAPLKACSCRRLRGLAHLRALDGFADEIDEPVKRVLAISFLGAEAPRGEDEDTVLGEPVTGKLREPRAHILGQGWRAAHIEAKLHGGGELVDILSARSAGPQKALFKLTLVKGKGACDLNHRRWSVAVLDPPGNGLGSGRGIC